MKKFIPILSLGLATTALVLGGVATLGKDATNVKATSDAAVPAPDYQTYVSVREGWMSPIEPDLDNYEHRIDFSGLLKDRNAMFWNTAETGWDSQNRTFNSTDEFVWTFLGSGGDGYKINYRTPELTLHDNEHRYICFNYSGRNCDDIFINVFNITQGKDKVSGYKTHFVEKVNDAGFDEDAKDNKYGAITCNQTFHYLELPADKFNVGDRYLLFVHDGSSDGFGFFTFGGLYINQNISDVAKHFSAHKTQMLLNKQLNTSVWNNTAIDYVLNFYATDNYYAAVRTAEAALTDATDDFEVNTHLSNWAFDKGFSSTSGLDYNAITSSDDSKAGFGERMPANKSGNMYFNADTTGIGEGEKYRFVSNEFTLTGFKLNEGTEQEQKVGFISAKLGGGTAVLSLLDENWNELATTRKEPINGENILNPAFYDPAGGVANIMTSGARLNTMTRMYLDVSAHVGKKVRISISDDRTGGNWGLAYFDEIITKYNDYPTLKVDKIEQQYGDNPKYHGVVTDKYYGDKTTTFGKAYDLVQSYYAAFRNVAKGVSWCNAKTDSAVVAFRSAYDGITDAKVKELVDAAQDYDFGSSATSENWYLTEVNLEYNVGESMEAFETGVYPVHNSPFINALTSGDNNTIVVVGIVAIILIGVALGAVILKKKRSEI